MSYQRKTKPALWTELRDNGFGLSPRTDQRPNLEAKYLKRSKEFLKENPRCAVTGDKATQIHHSRGKLSGLLIDERFWIPVSFIAHRRIHDDPEFARKLTWQGIPVLCAPGDWCKQGE